MVQPDDTIQVIADSDQSATSDISQYHTRYHIFLLRILKDPNE